MLKAGEGMAHGSLWRRALVTGASSGIGEAFADELASMNVDLVLVARNLGALETVAARAHARGVRAEVLQVDLSTNEGVSNVVAAIREAQPRIDLLVNNAGLGQWGWFIDLPPQGAIETIRVNDEALVRLTHAAVSRMIEADHGSVIQISSMAAAAPGPQQAVYAATKAFVSSFGQALSAELATTAVTCTTVLPGFTRTNYFSRVGLSVEIPPNRWMTAQEVAHMSLDAAKHGRPLLIPGARNRRKLLMATPFPSLAIGRAKRRTGQALWFARRAQRRAAELLPTRAMSSAPASKRPRHN